MAVVAFIFNDPLLIPPSLFDQNLFIHPTLVMFPAGGGGSTTQYMNVVHGLGAWGRWRTTGAPDPTGADPGCPIAFISWTADSYAWESWIVVP